MRKRNLALLKNTTATYLAHQLLKRIGKLPPKTQITLGKKLGALLHLLLTRHKKWVNLNLSLCFPKESKKFYAALVSQYFESLGIGLIECCIAGFTPSTQFPAFQIHGWHHIQPLIDANKPIILVSAHFTTMVMMGRLLSTLFPYTCVFRLQRTGMFNHLLTEEASRRGVSLIRAKLSSIIKSLSKNNKILLYFIDQDHGEKHSVFAPFFGIQTATIKALPFIAKASNASVIPVFCYRNTDPLQYNLHFSAPLENYPQADEQQNAAHINQILESAIRKQPELFFWYYKRFRTRPEGEPSFYF